MTLLDVRETVARFLKAQDSLVLQASDLSLGSLHEMATKGAIDLQPMYQRRERWNPDKQSALIESFILNVPVPPIYLSEDDFGQYSVIDGKQRLTAVKAFLSDELSLRGLTEFPELNGFRYSDLPIQLRNALTMRPYFRVVTLLKQTDPDLKYEVFLRLNTGGDHLRPQEIRNVAFSGPLNDLLFELAEHPFLKDRLRIDGSQSPAYRNMDDVEHVLRFLTMYSEWREMGGSLSRHMDAFMARHRAAGSNVQSTMRANFVRAIEGCASVWGDIAFYKPLNEGWRAQMISPLYDAQMVSLAALDDATYANAMQNAERIVAATRSLFASDPKFVRSVTQATNNAANIQYRIGKMHASILTAIGG